MTVRSFHTITLGCKLNQFDSAGIEGELMRRGFHQQPDASRAGVVIINTCTVTHKTDTDARKLIRRVRRNNPECRLLVTGCYAEHSPEEIRAVATIDRVFGNRDKPNVPRILDELGLVSDPATNACTDSGTTGLIQLGAPKILPETVHFGNRSRAFLKIQDGCRLSCSYCIIPTVRGASESVPIDEIENAALSILEAGFREIVLTGQNTGDYGRDLPDRSNLCDLLRRLLAVCGPNRLRLNSLEPLTVTDELIELMASDSRLAPHLQVPLQSGSEALLRAMRRNYNATTYMSVLERLRKAIPHIGLGADVIVGFPGETEQLFQETYDLIARSPLNYLHIFSWSARPGTPAQDLSDHPNASDVRSRSARLHELAADSGERFRRRFLNQRLDAVVLGEKRDGHGLRALTGNFIEVSLPPGSAAAREPLEVQITSVGRDETQAIGVGSPAWSG
jgi:threonylcarbamoyladenosine tRNA methylthiotransferase MtaB